MDIDVNKESICINKIVAEKQELVFVEEDMIVPDSKPDILNAINLSGNVCIYKKEVLDGKVKIEGCVNTYIMYLPDSEEDNLRGLNANIDFTQVIQIPESKQGMDLAVCVSIKDLECKVINGRKINVRAGLDVKIKLYSNENIEIIQELKNLEDVQILNQIQSINSLVGTSSARVYVKDSLSIDEKDEIAEILKAEVNLINSDIKISYNKILSKSEIEIKIMYLTEDNRINTVQGNIPAVGFIDMQNISEENICEINNEINNIIIKPNSAEEHSIYVEFEIETSCTAYEKREIALIRDLYSTSIDVAFTQKKVSTMSEKVHNSKQFTVTSKTNIPELINGNLLDVETKVTINKEQITNSKIMFEGELAVNFIFNNENNNVNSKTSKISFEFDIENPMHNENINCNTKVSVINKKFDVKPNGDIECNIDLEAITDLAQNINMNIIDNVEVQENRIDSNDYDSLIIYIVQKGDTLWKIAKKFRSTVDDIARMNGIEDVDKLDVGQKLYIPKFKYNQKGSINAVSA